MYTHAYYLNRNLEPNIIEKIAYFIFSEDLNSDYVSLKKSFLDIIDLSYRVKRERRPSVSQLADMFRKYGCQKPGTLACEYAKALEKKAKQDNNFEFIV